MPRRAPGRGISRAPAQLPSSALARGRPVRFGPPTRTVGPLTHRWVQATVRRWPGFRSAFPPPDARPRGTGQNGRGRRVTAEAVDRPLRTSQMMIGSTWGWDGMGAAEAMAVRPQIASIAFRFESYPFHATAHLQKRTRRPFDQAGFEFRMPSPDALPTPPVHPALLGRRCPRSAGPAGARSGGAGECTRAGRARRRRRGAVARR
jgi:hypothetical protein